MYNLVTRDDVVEYTKSRLGHPLVEIELELQEKNGLGHIHMAINDCMDFFYRHNADEAIFHDWMVLYLKQGIIEYFVPEEVTDVIDVGVSYGNSFTPWTAIGIGAMESLVNINGGQFGSFDLVTYSGAMRYMSDVQKMVGVQYNVRFHAQEHKLRIIPTPKADSIVMCKIYRKAAMAEVYTNIYFRDMVVARCKEIWGEILSRDDITFPGGGKVNGQGLLANARIDRERLEKAIIEQSAPAFLMTDLSL